MHRDSLADQRRVGRLRGGRPAAALHRAGRSCSVDIASESGRSPTIANRPPRFTARLAPARADRRDAKRDRRRRAARSPIDRYWIFTLLIVFFAIHVGRMDAEWNLVGLFSPAWRWSGDVFFALVLAYVLIVPARLAWRFVTRPLVRRLWHWTTLRKRRQSARRPARAMLVRWWLARRMRFDLRIARAKAIARHGDAEPVCELGLPITAVLVAFAPLAGRELVFQHRDLGHRRMGNLGGPPHRRLAAGDDRRRQQRRQSRIAGGDCSACIPTSTATKTSASS